MNVGSEVKRAVKIISILKDEYPDVKSALNYSGPFELLVATILSAQCTDARVNIITEALFKKYTRPEDYASAASEELEKDIFSAGFYKQKAKSIKACCTELIEKYKGRVPTDFDSLAALPGVGRKTASVVAGNAFGIPAIAVDTHVRRLSNLLGFIESDNPEKIELRLRELIPEEDWVKASHLIAAHGRKICIARRPKCGECAVAAFCPSSK
jgi:endonuclease-3